MPAVLGTQTDPNGTGEGVKGTSTANSGVGVLGVATGNLGISVKGSGGMIGVWADTWQTYSAGIQANCAGINGYGLYSVATNSGAVGGFFRADAGYSLWVETLNSNLTTAYLHNTGANGIALSADGDALGVQAWSRITPSGWSSAYAGLSAAGYVNGARIDLWQSASDQTGCRALDVRAPTKSGSTQYSYGLCADNQNSISGSYGANISGNWRGLYCYGNASLAAYFAGGVQISGYLTKSGGGSRTDHPQYPGTKLLNHHFAESDEMLQIYRVVGTLDKDGHAVLVLPDYFASANRNIEAQVSGRYECMAGLKFRVIGNEVHVTRGVPGEDVLAVVTGARADAWALANNPGNVIEKTAEERGKYLHPELFGHPPERGMNYVKREEHTASEPPARPDAARAPMQA